MVVFSNAWQITGDEAFIQDSLKSWQFIQNLILDKRNGECFWGIKEDNTIMKDDKV